MKGQEAVEADWNTGNFLNLLLDIIIYLFDLSDVLNESRFP